MPRQFVKKESGAVSKNTVKKSVAKKVAASGAKPSVGNVGSPVSSVRTSAMKKTPSRVDSENVEKILVENFVALQKVMVNLSVKLDNLTGQISQLLNLFDISARALAEKGGGFGMQDKRMMEKIDNILDQNKTIARGVSLLHEGEPMENPQQRPREMPSRRPSPPQAPRGIQGYESSISSKPQSFNKPPRR